MKVTLGGVVVVVGGARIRTGSRTSVQRRRRSGGSREGVKEIQHTYGPEVWDEEGEEDQELSGTLLVEITMDVEA